MKYSRLLFVGGGMLASVFAAFSAKKSDKPNIVFILCDDMGYGDLGCYGQKYIETPNIDRMASEGMRFTQAYSGSPVSAPSRACIMTDTEKYEEIKSIGEIVARCVMELIPTMPS